MTDTELLKLVNETEEAIGRGLAFVDFANIFRQIAAEVRRRIEAE